MSTQPSSPEDSDGSRKRGRKRFFWIGTILVVFLSCLTLYFVHETSLGGKFSWLGPASFGPSGPPGPLTRLKWRMRTWPVVAPLLARSRAQQPRILVTSSIWTIPPAAMNEMTLGAPIATNANGVQVWILPPARLNKLKQQISGMPGASTLMAPSILLLNGTHGQVQAGTTTNIAGTNLFNGLVIDVEAKTMFSSIKTSVGVTATELTNPSDHSLPKIKINLTAACQTLVLNNGALVIDGGTARDGKGNGYWIMVSPSALDAKGKPLELKAR